jgi:hypothetical protein
MKPSLKHQMDVHRARRAAAQPTQQEPTEERRPGLLMDLLKGYLIAGFMGLLLYYYVIGWAHVSPTAGGRGWDHPLQAIYYYPADWIFRKLNTPKPESSALSTSPAQNFPIL